MAICKKEDMKPEPDSVWLFEQASGNWMAWTGTEENLREFIEESGLIAIEYKKTGKVINDYE